MRLMKTPRGGKINAVENSYCVCKKHTRYQGKSRPKTDCMGCWIVWTMVQPYEEARKYVVVESEMERETQDEKRMAA